MFSIEYTGQFKKDLRRSKRRGLPLEKLENIMGIIALQDPIPESFKDHQLSGNWKGHRELHILPDWLLIYRVIEDDQTVIFVRVGSHADLF